jgi:type I restriction enzyme S subunit
MGAIIDYRGKSPEKTTFGIPLVTAKIIKSGRIEKPEEFIAEPDYETWMRRGIPQKGDVVMTTEAPLGEVAQLDDQKVALAQRVITLRGKADVLDNTFLKFLLQWEPIQEQLRARSTGTTVLGIRQSELRKVSLPVPPLAEQKAIAAVLGALDDKIELNRRMNATLEAIARTLFQSWFVDFDPVRAKLDGRQPTGLDPATAALFPSELEDSELGPIPKGWKVLPLPEAIAVNPTRRLQPGTVASYLDMKNMPTQGHCPDEVIQREFTSGTKFQNGDTLLARITSCLENGKTAFVDFLADGEIGWGSTEYIVFAPKPPLPPQFGYLLARSDSVRAHAIQNMTGTSGRQRVPPECFSTYTLVVPPAAIAIRFGEITAPFFTTIKSNTAQSRTLASFRDTLAPKILSGEIRVSYEC